MKTGDVMSSGDKGINTFQRYLSVWGILCMAAGVLTGSFLSGLRRLQILASA